MSTAASAAASAAAHVTPGPPPGGHGRLLQLLRFVLGTGLASGLTMLWSAWVGRQLGPAASADYFAALFVLQGLYMVGYPLNAATARFGAQWTTQGRPARVLDLSRWLLRGCALVGLPLGLVVAVTLPWQVATLQFTSPLVLAIGWIGGALAIGAGVLRGALRGVLLLGALSFSFLFEALLRLAVGVPALSALASADVAISVHALASLAAIAAIAWALRAKVEGQGGSRRAKPVEVVELRRWLLPMFGLAAADALWQNADALFAKHILDDATAGHYGAVMTLCRLFGVVVQPFALLVIPLLVEADSRDGDGDGHGAGGGGRRLAALLGAFLAVATVALSALAIWPGPALRMVFGPTFVDAAPLVLPLSLGALASYTAMLLGQAFAARGQFAFLSVHAAGLVSLGFVAVGATTGQQLAWWSAAAKVALVAGLVLAWLLQARQRQRLG